MQEYNQIMHPPPQPQHNTHEAAGVFNVFYACHSNYGYVNSRQLRQKDLLIYLYTNISPHMGV